MSTARKLQHTYPEYLDALDHSPLRLEFWAGEIVAMAGSSAPHEFLVARIILRLGQKLPLGCHPAGSNTRVRLVSQDVTLLPDATVVCGKLQSAKDDKSAIVNPSIVVEVCSPSTRAYDLGEKLRQYKQLPSVQSVLVFEQGKSKVTIVERHTRGWRSLERGAGEQIILSAPVLTLDVDDIYSVLDDL